MRGEGPPASDGDGDGDGDGGQEGWVRACARFVAAQGLEPELVGLLRAFGGSASTPLGSGLELDDFEVLEASAAAGGGVQEGAIVAALDGEVDAAQARLFARRFTAVCGLLDELGGSDAGARVLRVGLSRRLDDVLAAPAPRALRVRALVDFDDSQGAVRRHRRGLDELPALAARVRSARWSRVAPGVAHARVQGPSELGPVHINLLRLRGVRLEAAVSRGATDFAAWVEGRGAVAATSGGFFLYSEADISPPSARRDPVGLLICEGEVVGPPVLRRSTLVQDRLGRIGILRLGPEHAVVVLPDGRRLRPVPPQGPLPGGRLPRGCLPVVALNRAQAGEVRLDGQPGVALVGREIVAVSTVRLDVPLNGLVLKLPAGASLPSPGGRVRWIVDGDLQTAIAGGPRLLRDGRLELSLVEEDFAGSAPPVTFSQDETFDQNLLPRLAAGLAPDETLVLAAVDGRNLERAPGLTLRATAGVLRALGCTQAVNLDGGSSKRMVVEGRIVDLPSTEVVAGGGERSSVRPVNTALLVHSLV